ncbi:hypothetical protein [Comamonas sp.]|uniref:hypothetical protein n=1 Tax=Comamonas sp. TaxID=34028 RepID=UPI0028AA1DCA|nr:hypothetical protein [Comamonas sp.]
MVINGKLVQPGQVWRTRSGSEVVVLEVTKSRLFGGAILCSDAVWRNQRGGARHVVAGVHDLVFYVKDWEPSPPGSKPTPPETVTVGAAAPLRPELLATFEKVFSAFATSQTSAESALAPDLLEAAAGHMRDRAATYDKPAGERSMAATVRVFNAFHGTSISEAQGWHFMQILKDVRLFTNVDAPHRDSIEDGVAYAALKGESLLSPGEAE